MWLPSVSRGVSGKQLVGIILLLNWTATIWKQFVLALKQMLFHGANILNIFSFLEQRQSTALAMYFIGSFFFNVCPSKHSQLQPST